MYGTLHCRLLRDRYDGAHVGNVRRLVRVWDIWGRGCDQLRLRWSVFCWPVRPQHDSPNVCVLRRAVHRGLLLPRWFLFSNASALPRWLVLPIWFWRTDFLLCSPWLLLPPGLDDADEHHPLPHWRILRGRRRG